MDTGAGQDYGLVGMNSDKLKDTKAASSPFFTLSCPFPPFAVETFFLANLTHSEDFICHLHDEDPKGLSCDLTLANSTLMCPSHSHRGVQTKT